MIQHKKQFGFSLIEVLVAISFVAIIIMLILTVSYSNNKLYRLNEETTKVMFYASEAIEAVKMLDWDELAAGAYSISESGNSWSLTPGSQLIDEQFTRLITISDVYRQNSINDNVYGDIVSSGGFLDPDTKHVSVSMTWTSKSGLNKQEIVDVYLYRWSADRWNQNDWIGGSGQSNWSDETSFFSSSAGLDVSVAGMATLLSGFLDWNNASTTDIYNIGTSADRTGIDLSGDTVYLVTANNSSGSELFSFDVSDIYNIGYLGALNTGGLNNIRVKGDYAYIAGRRNSAEFRIVDVSNPGSLSTEDTYDLDGSANAIDVAVDETEAYIIRDDTLYSFSVIDPSDIQPLGNTLVDEEAVAMFLLENHIYIASTDDSRELQVFDITNPVNMQQVAFYDLPGTADATDVVAKGNKVYISTEDNSSGDELFIFDVSDPEDPLFVGDYSVNDTIFSLAVVGPYALLGVDSSSQELLVLDVSFPSTINVAGSFDLDGYLYTIVADCANVYAGTSNSNEDLLAFSTGDLNCGYADSGTLESSTFDTGSDEVAYNWIAWTGSEPIDTDIRFQIATSASVGGPWNYVGPDGTNSTYYSTAAYELINYNHHLNQRYLRYKLFLSTDAELQVPTLEDVTISYTIN